MAIAQTAAPSLVVLVTPDPAASMARTLSNDLQGIGFDVLVFRSTPENSTGPKSLEQAARAVGAIAAVRLVPSGIGTEVWVADRVTGKTLVRELIRPNTAEAEPDDVALGTIELLRASLMELHAPSAPRGDVEPSAAVRELAGPPRTPIAAVPAPATTPAIPPPEPPRFSLMLGPSVDLGLGTGGPSLQGYSAVGAPFGERFALRAFASLPIGTAAITVAEGTVETSANVFGLGASYDLARSDRTLVPVVGVGAVLARVQAVGDANAPLIGTQSADWMAGAYAQVCVAALLTSGIRLRLDTTAVFVRRPFEIMVNGRSLGRWGEPAILLALGMEVIR